MPLVEKVEYKRKIFALILRSHTKIDGLKFLTPLEYPFQIGVHLRKQGTDIMPHIHKDVSRVIKTTQEMIYIVYGKVRVNFYDGKKKVVTSRILNSGDTILLTYGGHGFRLLKETKMIEVKQGPYMGVEVDKKKF